MWSEPWETIPFSAIGIGYLLVVCSIVVRGRVFERGHIKSRVADGLAGVGMVLMVGGLLALMP